jgi:adenylate kinase family enzyme
VHALPRRIAIVGTTGSGKSTLGRILAERARLPYVELDELYYAPGWQRAAEQSFFDQVIRHAGTDEWIIDGNYEAVRDIVWVRAQSLIWLDYPLSTVLWRLLRRTIGRLLRAEPIANGNRESLSRILGKDSIFLWAIRTHRPRQKKLEQLLAGKRYAHLSVQRFRSPREVAAWLENEA